MCVADGAGSGTCVNDGSDLYKFYSAGSMNLTFCHRTGLSLSKCVYEISATAFIPGEIYGSVYENKQLATSNVLVTSTYPIAMGIRGVESNPTSGKISL